MSQYPQYTNNGAGLSVGNGVGNGVENNMYNIPASDMNMVLKQIMGNSSNNAIVPQNMNAIENQYYQQNKVPNQYYIPIPTNYSQAQQQYMPMLPFSNQNFIYLNPQTQFPISNQQAPFNIQSVIPMNMQNGIFQMDNSDPNKDNLQSILSNSRSKKKTYKVNPKPEMGNLDSNDDIPRDTRNRPLSFSCGVCSKRFSTQTRLDQHNLCHTGDRPYVCKECNFAFTQKSYLMRHAAVHKDERSFECELCKKTYKHYGSLANHRKTHKNGNKSNSSQIENNVNILSDNNPVLSKTEESLDGANNHPTNSYIPIANNEYTYQSQPEIQQGDPNQSYGSQLMPDANFNSFRNLLNSENPVSFESNFTNQLNNFNHDDFYSLVSNAISNANRDSSANHHDSQSDLVNLSLVKSEPSFLASLKDSDQNEEYIPTFTV